MDTETVDEYLTLGFEADFALAESYLQDLLPGAPGDQEAPSADLLCRILEDHTTARGHAEVSLPLTGGLDSRGLLGAALSLFPSAAITCYTYGPASYPDVVTARQTCADLGIAHERIDPDEIAWDLDLLMDASRRHATDGTGILPVDAMMVFEALASRMGTRRPVLSGYLGDATSGHQIPGSIRACHDLEPALDAFFAYNSELGDSGSDPRRRQRFGTFAEEHATLTDRWPGLCTFDLLDFSFRQRRRIRGAVVGAFPSGVCPYEDPRWVGAWMSRPITERQGQSTYRRLLHGAFPSAFVQTAVTRRPGSSLGHLRRLVPVGVKRAIRRPQPASRTFSGRGDPRRNVTMAHVLRETTAAFDRSRLCPTLDATGALDQLLTAPDQDNYMKTRWAASVGLRLLAERR